MMDLVHLECGRDRAIFQKTSCYHSSGKWCAAERSMSKGEVRSRVCDGYYRVPPTMGRYARCEVGCNRTCEINNSQIFLPINNVKWFLQYNWSFNSKNSTWHIKQIFRRLKKPSCLILCAYCVLFIFLWSPINNSLVCNN